jgi:hypothetical protein
MVNEWVDHIRAFAKKNNIAYACALSNPKCRASYKPKKLSAKMILSDFEGIEDSDFKAMLSDLTKRLKRSSPDEALRETLILFGYS